MLKFLAQKKPTKQGIMQSVFSLHWGHNYTESLEIYIFNAFFLALEPKVFEVLIGSFSCILVEQQILEYYET